jgi:hypothetical protein
MSDEEKEIYAITNLKGYASEMREAAANSFSESHDDIDSYISLHQMINLVKSECIGFDDQNRPLLNEDANEKIYESTVTWINNFGLAKLASQGYVECAWDDKTNEMVFWANEQTANYRNTSKMVNKTRGSNDKPIKRRNKKKNKGS